MPFTVGGDWIPNEEPTLSKPKRPTSVRSEKRKHSRVTVIRNLPGTSQELSRIASLLKRKCSCGGTVKDGIIEIQGDKIEEVRALLKEQGIKTS